MDSYEEYHEYINQFSSDWSGYSDYDEDQDIEHYGKGHKDGGHSGRYPWGSGDNPYQRPEGGLYAEEFMARYKELHDAGLSDGEIFKSMGFHGESYTDADGNVHEKKLSDQYIRAIKGIAYDQSTIANIYRAKELIEGKDPEHPECKGNYSATGRVMGIGDTSVRSLLKPANEYNRKIAGNVAEVLREELAKTKSGVIDVGKGTERDDKLGVSDEQLDKALEILKSEGYGVYGLSIPNVTNPQHVINTRVLAKIDDQYKNLDDLGQEVKDMYSKKIYPALNTGEIGFIGEYHSQDNGKSFRKWHYPESLDSKRLMVRYAEDKLPDGSVGKDRDGLILLRPGVEDISLGDDMYSQVRIMVDGKSYLKGMAAYGDPKEFPPGVDVIFNTNKARGTSLHEEKGTGRESVLKKLKTNSDGTINRDNPFGAAIKEGPQGQRWYPPDADPSKQKLSLINKNKEEGDWSEWKDKLPAQFLSKQPESLIKPQLEKSIDKKKQEFEVIQSLTNPVIKKYYLEKFAESCDTSARDLKAASIPGQKYQVFLPVPSLKDDEVYAPNYKNGTQVAIIRFPHAGTFEIPIRTVNNGNKEARQLMGTHAQDAIGINSKTAGILSGADFDGDAGIVIPLSDKIKVQNHDPLRALKGFEPGELYGTHQEGVKIRHKKNKETGEVEEYEEPIIVSNVTGKPVHLMSKQNVGKEMGVISNLITDMTLRGAPIEDETGQGLDIAHAVRHSMVVIDAYKHHYDYKQSEKDNHIKELIAKYQTHYDLDGNFKPGGASTLISRAKADWTVKERQGQGKIDKETGEVTYNESGRTYTKYKNGKVVSEGNVAVTTIAQMDAVKDAYDLISPFNNPKERLYADYANANKALANEARKALVNTKLPGVNSSAKKVYANEIASLEVKVNNALKNAPRERKANVLANSVVKAAITDNPGLKDDKEALRKIRQRAIENSRQEVGTVKRSQRYIPITDREWECIQANGISSKKLQTILDNTDPDDLRTRAMPSQRTTISDSTKAKVRQFASKPNWTNAEIAEMFGISVSEVSKIANGKE